jgi:uncharacterized protein
VLRFRDSSLIMMLTISIWSSLSNAESPIRILSIDGGGVRGIIPAVILEKIEADLGKPIASIFDMVAGSSTGGMIALALTAPGADKRPVQTAGQIVDFYIDSGSTVFKTSWRHWLKNLGGLIGPRYDSSGLQGIFYKYLGDTMLSEALVPTLITGYHINGQAGVEFLSTDAKQYPNDRDCLMREVAMATSAAPVYFDSVDVNFGWGTLESVADGCLYKLNPALLAYAQAKRLYPNRRIEVYSLGTGQSSAEDLTLELKGRGVWHWMGPVVSHLLVGNTEADDSVMHQMLNKEGERNYFRLNVRIDREHRGLDDISAENVAYLYNRGILVTQSGVFKEAMERLKTHE